ncbi:MAG: 6-bladed beta-propeller [Candidatus Aminicenantes bacterium]|nr:6-bladed beta-propeller [Candidatus Aminicenantes bacterium]
MIGRIRRTEFTACVALGLVVFWCVADAFPRGGPSGPQESLLWIQEGKRLYDSGEYEEAVRKLLEGLKKAKVKTEAADARFYLSLSYYALGRTDDCLDQLNQLFEIQPQRAIDERFYASGYVELYHKTRAEKLRGQPAAPSAPRVAAKEAPDKPGRGKKFPWLIVAGGAAAVGIAAFFLLGKKESTPALPQTGSIAVVSNPKNAKVFLDNADTGQRSDCTLANISPGNHVVRLDLEDYGRWEGSVNVVAGQTAQVNVVLGPFAYDFVTGWGTQGAGNGQFELPVGISSPTSGEVWVADTYNHRVQKFGSDGAFLIKWGSRGTGNGQLDLPHGIALSSGNVFVADSENNRIQKFSSSGGYLAQWGSQGTNTGQFQTPMGIASDSSGRIFVADTLNSRVQVFQADGTFVTSWGGQGTGDGQFYHPVGIAVDKDGYLYVADKLNHRIQKFNSSGVFQLKLGTGTGGQGDGQFNNPWGVATDSYGYVFVADTDNHRIQKFSSTGAFVVKWGAQGAEFRTFNPPKAIAVDSANNIYVLDTGNFRVQKFKISVQVMGGSASIQSSGPPVSPFALRPGAPGRLLSGPPRAVPRLPSEKRDKTRG